MKIDLKLSDLIWLQLLLIFLKFQLESLYLLDTLGGIVNPANIADIIPAAKAAVIIRNAIEYLPHFINMLSSFLFSMAVFVSLHSD